MFALEYTVGEAIGDYQGLISNYPTFYVVLFAAIVFGSLVFINLNTKRGFYLTFFALVLLIIASFYFRGLDLFKHIDSIFNEYFYQNIIFYYWNTIIAFMVIHFTMNSKSKEKTTKRIVGIIYILLLANVIFSFYITNSMQNLYLLVLGNISPMIVIGNIMALFLYAYLIVLGFITLVRKI